MLKALPQKGRKGKDLDAALKHAPFLTSKEADMLIEGLRREKFFENRKYDAVNQRWVAMKCQI